MDINEFKKIFSKIKGKTIAIVYIFEGDNSAGFNHFFIWRSSIITKWLNAIEEIHCLPLILDVRTFVDKAMNNSLPHIDCVINMNSGTYDLSSMALVPSTCSSIGVPCIPCNAVTIVTGENKNLSNLIANSIGLKIPKYLNSDDENGIFRPINLGNSLGVTRGKNSQYEEGIYQEFIKGYDITTPIVYNPIYNKMDFLPSIIYLPDNNDLSWFNGEKEKKTRKGYCFKIVELEENLKEKYLELVNTLSIKTFCRIDARVKSKEIKYDGNRQNIIKLDDTYFIEINVMPTIRDNNNFEFSFNSINDNNSFYSYINLQKDLFGKVNLNSFLLTSSMFSLLKNN